MVVAVDYRNSDFSSSFFKKCVFLFFESSVWFLWFRVVGLSFRESIWFFSFWKRGGGAGGAFGVRQALGFRFRV